MILDTFSGLKIAREKLEGRPKAGFLNCADKRQSNQLFLYHRMLLFTLLILNDSIVIFKSGAGHHEEIDLSGDNSQVAVLPLQRGCPIVQYFLFDHFFVLDAGLMPQFVTVISFLCAVDGVMKFGS